jgi:hypothetical protein
MLSDRLKEVRAAVEASPSKIVVIASRDHQDNTPGSWHASKVSLPDGSRGWDHISLAYLDKNGELAFVEKRPTPGDGLGPLGSKNSSGTAGELVTEYKEFQLIPIDLRRLGPGAEDRFLKGTLDAINRPYALLDPRFGDHCASAIGKGFAAAEGKISPTASTAERAQDWVSKLGLPKWLNDAVGLFVAYKLRPGPISVDNTQYIPNHAYLEGMKYAVPYHFDPEQDNTLPHNWAEKAYESFAPHDNPESLALSSDAIATSSHEGRRILRHAVTDGEEGAPPSKQVATASDEEDARGDDAAQQPATEDDEEASKEEVALASDAEDTGTDGAAQQPETDDDEDASEEQAALASDSEDAPTDRAPQQPETDDDQEASQEQVSLASDTEDAPTDDAAVMETASAQAGTDPTSADQAGSQLAGSSPSIPDDGFSFSAFPKQGVPIEVAKEAMPAERLSSEESSSSGVPSGESVPDFGSEDVGNAAPSKEPVVHHGDLAP